MHSHAEKIVIFLCCSSEDCARFTGHLREEKLSNEVRLVTEARDLVGALDQLPPPRARALVILDTGLENAWDAFDALRASHLKAVPVLAICEPEESAAAYVRGVNAVLPREHWEKNFGSTAARLTAFWLQLVHLPETPSKGKSQA